MQTLLDAMTENRYRVTDNEIFGHIYYIEIISKLTCDDLMFKSGKAHNLLSRVENTED